MSTTIYSNSSLLDWNAKGDERIVQNVLNILRTRKYEVPFERELGINPDLIDADPRTIQNEIITHVTETINTYEPRATVVEVRIETVDENGDYVIAVDLEV